MTEKNLEQSPTEVNNSPINHGKKKILNLGSGTDWYGTHRLDFKKTEPAVTHEYDLNGNNKIPFPNNYFDEIRFWRTLEHLADLGNIIRECYRVLKKGGKIDVITDNAAYLVFHVKSEHNQYKFQAGYNRHPDDYHLHLFVPSHLDALFRRFKNIKITYLHRNNKKGLKKLFLNSIPFNMGYEELHLIAEK